MNIYKGILFLLFFSQAAYGQFALNYNKSKFKNPPSTAYTLIQTCEGEPRRLLKYNDDGESYFSCTVSDYDWNGKPMVHVYAHDFDEFGRDEKYYSFHSNIGLTIYSYEYVENPYRRIKYVQKYKPGIELKKNSNHYAYISKFKSLAQLKASEEVITTLAAPKKKQVVQILNNDGLPVEIREYNALYRDSMLTTIQYDEDGVELLRNRSLLSEANKNFFKEINRNHHKEFDELIDENKHTRTTFRREKKKLIIKHYTYDVDDYLMKIEIYKTKFKDELIVPIDSKLQKTAQMIFIRNEDGLVIRETMTNFVEDTIDVRNYEYQLVID